MPKNWARGLTVNTDERIAKIAHAHRGLRYKILKRHNAYFIWTHELAYAMGLLTTDGNLSTDGRHLDFTSKDIELVESFKKIMHLKNKIGRKRSGSEQEKKYFRIQFGQAKLYEWLLKIGLSPNKSKILQDIKIPDQYFFDFLRGCFDGDGNFRSYKDPLWINSVRRYLSLASASKLNLEWVQNTLERLLGVKGTIQNGTRCFKLVYAKTESLKLLPKIYYKDNLTYLKRKYAIIQPFLTKELRKSQSYTFKS